MPETFPGPPLRSAATMELDEELQTFWPSACYLPSARPRRLMLSQKAFRVLALKTDFAQEGRFAKPNGGAVILPQTINRIVRSLMAGGSTLVRDLAQARHQQRNEGATNEITKHFKRIEQR